MGQISIAVDSYPSDLSAGAWHYLKPHLPVSVVGRPRKLSLRRVINAISYVLKTGCQWRQLPCKFPAWSAVYYYFRCWSRNGTWKRIHHLLRSWLREKCGRHKHPTAGCLDSQSVKCTAVSGQCGFDAGKKVNGRKRHILVDTLGLVLTVVVTVASVQDRDAARLLLRHLPGSCKKLKKIWIDGGYSGRLVEWVAAQFKFCLAVVLRPTKTRKFVFATPTLGGRAHFRLVESFTQA
ncbi:putative transposase [Nitrosomonas sp. Nm58]|nr:putative transposase [Nitrosomonas sp. Nm58]